MEEFELEPGETIITEVRQHIVVLFLRMLSFAFLAILPLIILPVFSALQQSGADAAAYEFGPVFRFFLGIWWLFLWMAMFTVITRYFLTVWIITSHRIVDISQDGFFRRKVSSFLLARVQDVTTHVSGILGTLIGWGELNVETAGSAEKFCMHDVKDPEGVRDLIMREVAILHKNDQITSV